MVLEKRILQICLRIIYVGFDGSDIQNENKDYAIIRFGAWKNDFWDRFSKG